MNSNDDFAQFQRELDASVDGYLAAAPGADSDSIRANLTFVRALQIWQGTASLKSNDEGRVPQPQYALLRLVFFTEERRMAQGEIARSLGVTGTYITRLIDGLENVGYIERIVSSEDRRVTYACLTPAGEEYCRRAIPRAIESMEAFFRHFTTEEKQAFEYLVSKFSAGVAGARLSEAAFLPGF